LKQLKQIIKEKKSVILRFDSAMNETIKTDWFDDSAANNENEHIVYCHVDTDVVPRDDKGDKGHFDFEQMALPRIEFFIDGEIFDMIEGRQKESCKKHFDYLIEELD
jgi:hypothetical protein